MASQDLTRQERSEIRAAEFEATREAAIKARNEGPRSNKDPRIAPALPQVFRDAPTMGLIAKEKLRWKALDDKWKAAKETDNFAVRDEALRKRNASGNEVRRLEKLAATLEEELISGSPGGWKRRMIESQWSEDTDKGVRLANTKGKDGWDVWTKQQRGRVLLAGVEKSKQEWDAKLDILRTEIRELRGDGSKR